MNLLPQLHALRVVAAKELRDRLRNRWVLVAALVLAVFALLIAYVGGAQGGSVGFRGIGATLASLTSLAIYLVPLIALLLGFDAIVGERERGTLDLMLSMPLTRGELLLGKYLGLATALALATLLGFGCALVPLAPHLQWHSVLLYAGFVASVLALGLSFLSLGVLASVVSPDRARAAGMAVLLWFGLVLVFDLVLLGALVASAGRSAGAWAPYALLFNPADVFRIFNATATDTLRNAFGLATLLPETWSHPLMLGLVMLAWILAPLGVAIWRFR